MKKITAIAALLFALPVFATTTFTQDSTFDAAFVRVGVATCTTGTEAAPTGTTAGIDLTGSKGFVVYAEAAAAMTAGGKLVAYLYNPVTARWTPAPDLDLTVAAIQYQAFAGFTTTSDFARIAYVPSGVGQAVTVYIMARKLPPTLR